MSSPVRITTLTQLHIEEYVESVCVQARHGTVCRCQQSCRVTQYLCTHWTSLAMLRWPLAR